MTVPLLFIKGRLTGDNFPSTEAFIMPEGSDTKVFLGVGQINSDVDPNSGLYGVPSQLAGVNTRPITEFNLRLTYDENGHVTHIENKNEEDSEPIPIKKWNAQFENKSPQVKDE